MAREIKMAIFIVFALVGFIGLGRNGYGASLPKNQIQWAADRHISSEVEVYRSETTPSDKLKMIELCRKLEADAAQADAKRKTELDIYREDMEPGVTEYRREVHESNRFSDAEGEQRTLQLCKRLEDSTLEPQESEIRVYRERTVPRTDED